MFSVSSAFLTALRSSSMVMSVQVTASNGTTLSVTGGSVSMDARRSITRTAQLELVATSMLTVAQIYALVMTPNIEITIKRGLKLADGSIEYVSLGVFSTDSATVNRATGGVVSWNGSDRSKKISRARFTDPYKIAAGTTLATAVGNLLTSRWSQVTTNFSNINDTITAQIVFEAGEASDPWDQARSLCADYGYDLNFDGLGTARMVAVQDPASVSAAFDFGAASTNLVMGGETSGDFDGTYNGVIATGEGTSVASPIRAEAWDTDPASPTYYLGGYGKVPLFYSSPLLTTTAIATAAAKLLLAKLKGRQEGLSWPSVVNPALEPLDVVQLTLKGTVYKVAIDQITIPLKASEAMTATARQTTT